LGFVLGLRIDSPEEGAMLGMRDFGRFGDGRLQKGGPIFWRLSLAEAVRAYGDLAATAPRRSGSGAFFTTGA
jgi:hypothetical protein